MGYNTKRFKKVISRRRLAVILSDDHGNHKYELGRHNKLAGVKVVVKDGAIVAQARTWAECAAQLGVRI